LKLREIALRLDRAIARGEIEITGVAGTSSVTSITACARIGDFATALSPYTSKNLIGRKLKMLIPESEFRLLTRFELG